MSVVFYLLVTSLHLKFFFLWIILYSSIVMPFISGALFQIEFRNQSPKWIKYSWHRWLTCAATKISFFLHFACREFQINRMWMKVEEKKRQEHSLEFHIADCIILSRRLRYICDLITISWEVIISCFNNIYYTIAIELSVFS